LRYKRSIYIVEDIAKGERVTKENTRVIRPGDGLNPKYFDMIQNSKVVTNIKKGTPFTWNSIIEE